MEDDEDEMVTPVKRERKAMSQAKQQQQQPDQLVAGLPNELLLPGAIVTLAVVIIGVFTISRASR